MPTRTSSTSTPPRFAQAAFCCCYAVVGTTPVCQWSQKSQLVNVERNMAGAKTIKDILLVTRILRCQKYSKKLLNKSSHIQLARAWKGAKELEVSKSLQNRELRSYPQVSKHILDKDIQPFRPKLRVFSFFEAPELGRIPPRNMSD